MTDMSVADVLERAADLIEPEGAWTQFQEARDSRGQAIGPRQSRAASWCMIGACRRVSRRALRNGDKVWSAIEDVIPSGVSISGWNDRKGRSHAGVVARLRKAAALAREQGK